MGSGGGGQGRKRRNVGNSGGEHFYSGHYCWTELFIHSSDKAVTKIQVTFKVNHRDIFTSLRYIYYPRSFLVLPHLRRLPQLIVLFLVPALHGQQFIPHAGHWIVLSLF